MKEEGRFQIKDGKTATQRPPNEVGGSQRSKARPH